MARISGVFGLPEDRRSYEPGPEEILPLAKCRVGLEVEVEGLKSGTSIPHEVAGYYTTHPDGSLKNGGCEFVFSEPLFGADLIDAVRVFCSFAKDRKLLASHRAGIHVHLDVRNLSPEEVGSICFSYCVLERYIFKAFAPDRVNNSFCVPWYLAPAKINAYGFSNNDSKLIGAVERADKYSALNLAPIATYGSIEWRHKRTTFSEDEILTWIGAIQRFKRYARNNPMNYDASLRAISRGPIDFGMAVLGKYFNPGLYPDVERDILLGLKDAVEISLDTRVIRDEVGSMRHRAAKLPQLEERFEEKPRPKNLVEAFVEINAFTDNHFAQVADQHPQDGDPV